jgi:hypothetical protein
VILATILKVDAVYSFETLLLATILHSDVTQDTTMLNYYPVHRKTNENIFFLKYP